MAVQRQNHLRIRTPEGVEFSYLLAGPIARSLAWMIDAVMIFGLTMLAVYLLVLGVVAIGDFAVAMYAILLFLIQFGYAITLEWFWNGQTLGKKILKLRVIDGQGLELRFHQVVVRNLLRLIDFMPGFYLIGGITSVLNRHSQRLGDLAADTVVIRTPVVSREDLASVRSEKFNTLRNHPHLTARLQQRISPAEATVALRALQRRENLDPPARVELFRELADHFHAEVKFPEEVIEGMSDENFVRNAVEILFKPKAEGGK
ncbi:MAG: RDD family protein [Limisphaerales bacterium]